ncbi:MAG: glycosyltransferase, partial [Marinobacter sp.]
LGFRHDVAALMMAADGVVISSEREGFSYVCAEALLSGKPIISTNVPIANEFLPTRSICSAKTSEDFARYLNQDLEALTSSQADARKIACEKLTLQAMTKQTLAVYQKAIDHGQ